MPQALLFQPKENQHGLQRSLGTIPPYLFRLYAPTSAGCTNFNYVVSSAATRPSTWHTGRDQETDILQLPREMAADMLWNHINWKDLKDDNLMSWTTSLIYALQHGLRRVKMDRGKPDLSDVRICIVDARDFPRGTFIKDLDILEAYSDLPDIRSFLRLRQSQ